MAEAGSQAEAEALSWKAYAAVGVVWFLALETLSWIGADASALQLGVSSLAFVAMGALCWRNGQACGALHCRVSAPLYVVIGVLAGLGALGVVSLELGWLMWAFLAVAVGSFALETVVARSGSAPSEPGIDRRAERSRSW